MTQAYGAGDAVSWNYGGSSTSGRVKEVHTRRVERTIKGSKIVKNGSEDNPAYLIEQDDGDRVLKEHSELSKRRSSGGGSSGSGGPTKAELYEEAKKQDVEGRSSMSKDELRKAVG